MFMFKETASQSLWPSWTVPSAFSSSPQGLVDMEMQKMPLYGRIYELNPILVDVNSAINNKQPIHVMLALMGF